MQRHYIIHGRVQGVFFRDSTRRKALELGLGGWVRNRSDGTVEAVVQGPEGAVAELAQWFRAGGPRSARVDRVEEQEGPGDTFTDFHVR